MNIGDVVSQEHIFSFHRDLILIYHWIITVVEEHPDSRGRAWQVSGRCTQQ